MTFSLLDNIDLIIYLFLEILEMVPHQVERSHVPFYKDTFVTDAAYNTLMLFS